MSVFGENDSRCLSNFLQTHIFWNFDHISRTYNQINYRNIWFAKVIIILIMTAQVLFFDVFFEKDPHLNAVEKTVHKVLLSRSVVSCVVSSIHRHNISCFRLMSINTSPQYITLWVHEHQYIATIYHVLGSWASIGIICFILSEW